MEDELMTYAEHFSVLMEQYVFSRLRVRKNVDILNVNVECVLVFRGVLVLYCTSVFLFSLPPWKCNHCLKQCGIVNVIPTLFHSILQMVECPPQVVLQPSLKDMHHDMVYPQPPFPVGAVKGLPAGTLRCCPNPSILDVNNVIVASTSVDILMHINVEVLLQGYVDGGWGGGGGGWGGGGHQSVFRDADAVHSPGHVAE